jgi:hypothetical protein
MTEKGAEAFCMDFKKKGQSPEILRAMHTTCAHAGLVEYVANSIPCTCLDEKKKQVKAGPKIGRCLSCHKKVAYETEQLFECCTKGTQDVTKSGIGGYRGGREPVTTEVEVAGVST